MWASVAWCGAGGEKRWVDQSLWWRLGGSLLKLSARARDSSSAVGEPEGPGSAVSRSKGAAELQARREFAWKRGG